MPDERRNVNNNNIDSIIMLTVSRDECKYQKQPW